MEIDKDSQLPPWIGDDSATWIQRIDLDKRRLVLNRPLGASTATFGDIPRAWHITINTPHASGALEIRLTKQAAGVKWDVRDLTSSSITLPAAIRNISIIPRDGNATTTVTSHARSLAVKLAPGRFCIDVGPDGSGAYTVQEIPSDIDTVPFVFDGMGKLRRFRGIASHGVIVHTPASDIDMGHVSGSVTFASAPEGAVLKTDGAVNFTKGVQGRLDVTARIINAPDIVGSGVIRADELLVEGRITPNNGRLSMELSGLMWCRGGLHKTDITLCDKPGTANRVLVGVDNSNSGFAIDYGPVGNIHQASRARVRGGGGATGASITDSTIRGRGALEVAGSVESTLVDLEGIFVCAGSFNAQGLAADEDALKVSRSVVAGVLDLAGSQALVAERIDAAAVCNGRIDDSSGHLVVLTESVRDARIYSSTIVVRTEAPSVGAIFNSEVVGTHHLHVVGSVDATSTLEGHGDLSLTGDCDAAMPVSWMPGAPWHEIQAREFVVRGAVRSLQVRCDNSSLPQPRLTIRDDGKIESIDLSGQLVLNFERADETPLLNKLSLNNQAHAILEGSVAELPLVETTGHAAFTALIKEPEAEVKLGLVSKARDDRIDLDAGHGLIRVVEPIRFTSDPSTAAAAPMIVAIGGSIGIEVTLESLVCEPTEQGSVINLDVGDRGRVNALAGDFGLRRLTGRVHGVPRDRAATAPAVLRVLRGAQFEDIDGSGLSQTRIGQLIDVDISRLPAGDVPGLAALQVLTPSAEPLMKFASGLGPRGHGGISAYRDAVSRKREPLCDDNVRAEAQRLREIADIVRSRANSGSTYSAAQWAAAHAHALQVKWFSFERPLRWLHRLVGYGVRPGPALAFYIAWTLLVGLGLFWWDSDPGSLAASTDFRPGDYDLRASLGRAFLLPAGVLRSDVGGATPYRPAFESPVWHFVLVMITGLVVGFLAVALKNFLLRPKSDS